MVQEVRERSQSQVPRPFPEQLLPLTRTWLELLWWTVFISFLSIFYGWPEIVAYYRVRTRVNDMCSVEWICSADWKFVRIGCCCGNFGCYDRAERWETGHFILYQLSPHVSKDSSKPTTMCLNFLPKVRRMRHRPWDEALGLLSYDLCKTKDSLLLVWRFRGSCNPTGLRTTQLRRRDSTGVRRFYQQRLDLSDLFIASEHYIANNRMFMIQRGFLREERQLYRPVHLVK